jgi:hypothetical protein
VISESGEELSTGARRFLMPKRTSLFYRLLMVVFIVISMLLALFLYLLWETYVWFVLIGVSVIFYYAFWTLFRQPREIVLDDKQIIFKTFLGSITMELGDVISIECDYDKENRANAKVASNKRSFRFAPSLIKGWDEIIEGIRAVNPNIEVKLFKATD